VIVVHNSIKIEAYSNSRRLWSTFIRWKKK